MQRLLTILLLAFACAANAQLVPTNPPAGVVLIWDPSPSSEVFGYHVYWGPASRYYTNRVTTTNLTATINNLQRGSTYYFAATAFASEALESEFSNEVSYTPSSRPIAPVLRLSQVNGWQLQGAGEPYQTYQLQRTTNLVVWTDMATITADRQGLFTTSESRPAGMSVFYRTAL